MKTAACSRTRNLDNLKRGDKVDITVACLTGKVGQSVKVTCTDTLPVTSKRGS